ncbi:MAG: tRNA lysidine(34) synthetase TilS [Candidatus Baltobacteraceae bacterium]
MRGTEDVRGTHPLRALERAVRTGGALARGDRVLIACSGGSDSVGLAALLCTIAKPLGLQITLAHVNHGIRDSAWQDEAVVLRVSAALGVPVKIVALQNAAAREAELREARYGALCALARRCGANVVATGHTAEDQTETVLLALFRGAGTAGIAGMPARRALDEGVELARPLLRLTRGQVTGYVQSAGLPYAVDPTNADLTLRRNAVREALLALRPLFPRLDEAVSRAALLVGDELAGSPQAARRHLVRRTLQDSDALDGVDFAHIEAAVRALETGRSGRFAMARGVELTVENGAVAVHREVR